ncbi:hypothetical protein QJQ45_020921 [Haematococcus lacustris]|nr:hypothetical protein QJQ45_020921 [Haematococcus lacustris]
MHVGWPMSESSSVMVHVVTMNDMVVVLCCFTPLKPPAARLIDIGIVLHGPSKSDGTCWRKRSSPCSLFASVVSYFVPHSCFYVDAVCSVVVLSTSRHFAKIVCNSSSPLYVLSKGSELSLSSEVPTFVQAIASGQPMQIQADMEEAEGRTLGIDCLELLNKAGCTSFVILPLMFAGQAMGALMLAGDDTLNNGSPNQWMASFWPWVAMYVAEVNAIRLVDLLEKIQTAPSLHSLAHVVTNELKCWFEWPLKEETEARLVLLSEDQVSALVLSQPVAVDRGASSLTRTKSQPVPITTGTTRAVTFAGMGTRADEVRLASRAAIPALRRIGEQSADLALSKSAPPSSKSACSPEQDEDAGTLLGQGMRAEAAAALHTDKDGYGGGHEKRQPTSSSPGLAEGAGGAASPIRRTASSLSARQSTEGRLLGTQMSLLNTLTRRCLVEGSKLLFVADVMAALKKYGEPWKDIFLDQAQVANPVWVIAAPLASDGIHLGAIVWLSSSRLNPTMLASAAKTSLPPLLHSLADQLLLVTQQATQLRSHNSISAIDEVAPSDGASTSALMKVYQTAIAQHQRASSSTSVEPSVPYEEVEHEQRLCAYVQVMKQQMDGRRAMRTAWELAVTKSLQHSNVVAVLNVLTDVLVEKHSKRVIRFVPSTAVDAAITSWSSSMGVPTLSAAIGMDKESQPRCQVIIMEYCNLGPLHHFMAERRFLRPPPVEATRSSSLATGNATMGPSFPQSHSHSQSQHTSGSSKPSSSSTERTQQPSSATALAVDMPMVIATLSEVAEALQYLHSQGFIHCDLKPENILLKVAPVNPDPGFTLGDNRGFTAKVSDFGLSDLSTSEGLLMGELGGTVTHLDPCIVTQRKVRKDWILLQHSSISATGNLQVSKKSDVYSFGICMWELYTGQRPYIELLQSSKDKRSRDKLILSKVSRLIPRLFPCSGQQHSSSGRHLLSPMRCMFSAALQSLSSHLPGCGTGLALAALPLPLVGSAAGSNPSISVQADANKCKQKPQLEAPHTATAQLLHGDRQLHGVMADGVVVTSGGQALQVTCLLTSENVPYHANLTRPTGPLYLQVAHEHKRPVFPPYAPPDFVALATQCWHPDPAARPAFQVTVNCLWSFRLGEVLAELRIMQDRHGYVTAPLTIPNGTPALGPL